jgi:hypothetical protein
VKDPADMALLENHSGELTILVLTVLVLVTLIIIVPQLLRAYLRQWEMEHTEHMRSLEQGIPLPVPNEPPRLAGRTAMLVPMVALITAGTVTCFLVAYRSENVFSVALAVWSVAGIVSLAAITGGVALIGRLAQLEQGGEEDEFTQKRNRAS